MPRDGAATQDKIMAFFLFAVAAACPTSSSASETGCLHVPSAAVGSAFECADLCGPNATLACISSEAESAFVTRRWPGAYLWLGAYRARAVDHWHCASGGQLSYVNWGPGKPSPQSQRPNTTSCAEMFTGEWQGKAGRWYDTVGVNWEQPKWVQLGAYIRYVTIKSLRWRAASVGTALAHRRRSWRLSQRKQRPTQATTSRSFDPDRVSWSVRRWRAQRLWSTNPVPHSNSAITAVAAQRTATARRPSASISHSCCRC